MPESQPSPKLPSSFSANHTHLAVAPTSDTQVTIAPVEGAPFRVVILQRPGTAVPPHFLTIFGLN